MSRSTRLLGVLGGMGPLAAADFLKKLVEETPAQRDQDHIPYVAWGVPQIPDRPPAITGNGASPLPQMLAGILGLKQAGADTIAIACNTAHYWYDELLVGGGLPILHIADAACDELATLGVADGPVGLIGTDGTLQAGFYQQRFSDRGIECLTSTADEQRQLVLPAIAAVKSNALPQSHALAMQAVSALLDRGAKAVVLACTETPVAVEFRPHPLASRCVDATRALARRCVQWYLDEKHTGHV
jgi:aspartate racemase